MRSAAHLEWALKIRSNDSPTKYNLELPYQQTNTLNLLKPKCQYSINMKKPEKLNWMLKLPSSTAKFKIKTHSSLLGAGVK